MAVTLQNIAAMLNKMGLEYDEDESRIVVVAGGVDNTTYTFIRIKEDGEFVSIQTQLDKEGDEGFLKIPNDHKYIAELLKYLMKQNYEYKIGQWGYDHEDGDIRFIVNYAVEDGTLTQKQFERFIRITLKTADDGAVAIASILQTGKPKIDEAEELKKITARATSLMNANNFLDVQKILEKVGEGKIEEAKKILDQLEDSATGV